MSLNEPRYHRLSSTTTLADESDRGEQVVLKVWPIADPSLSGEELFPEQKMGIVKVDDKTVGIAASGGGSRSHALCAGYFRGFKKLGVLDKVAYLSSVSGGSWASAIFTYAKMDDDKLLGKCVNPEDLTLEFLETNCPGKLANAVKDFERNFFTLLAAPFHEKRRHWWQRYIGTSLLKEFHLKDKLFALSEEHKQEILEENEGCAFITEWADQIVCPPKGKHRPFLIINGSLAGPRHHNSGWGNSLQFTPLYSGVPFYPQEKLSFYYPNSKMENIFYKLFMLMWDALFGESYVKKLHEQMQRDLEIEQDVNERTLQTSLSSKFTRLLKGPFTTYGNLKDAGVMYLTGHSTNNPTRLITGGGVISTHAFGVYEFENSESMYGSTSCTAYNVNDKPFLLEDAIGISSIVIGAVGQNFGVDSLVPRRPYLPVLKRENTSFDLNSFQNHSRPNLLARGFGDGGNFENTGILPLLQRKVKRIIAFINTSEKLVEGDKFQEGIYKYDGAWCADPQLLCLFGEGHLINYQMNYTLNQVFEKEMLDEVLREMMNNRDIHGLGAVVKKKLMVQENKYWGIEGGFEVDIMLIYNDSCTEFIRQLPLETRRALGYELSYFERIRKTILPRPDLTVLHETLYAIVCWLISWIPFREWFKNTACGRFLREGFYRIGRVLRRIQLWTRTYYDFPGVGTVQFSFWRLFSLNQGEINLLTAQAQYIVAEANKEDILSMFR